METAGVPPDRALAMLADPDSVTARALGLSLASARTALEALDREALASVGIDVSVNVPAISGRVNERLRLTPAGRAVPGSAGGGRRTAGVKHVLLALLSRERPDPAAELFHALGVDRTEVRNRLQEV